MICKNCGQEIDTSIRMEDGTVQCPSCSAIYRHRRSNNTESISETSGKQVYNGDIAPALDISEQNSLNCVSDQTSETPANKPHASKNIYCPKCGKELKDGGIFCNRCRISLQNEAIKHNGISNSNKRFGLFGLSALIGIGTFFVLCLIERIKISRNFGAITSDAISICFAVYGVISIIILAVGALIYSCCNNNKMPCLICAVIELVITIALLIIAVPLLQLLHVNADVFGTCVTVIKGASLTGVFSTIIAALIGLLIKKKSIKPDIIIYSVVFFVSVITVFITIYELHMGFGVIAISIGLFPPFISILPCSLQEPKEKERKKSRKLLWLSLVILLTSMIGVLGYLFFTGRLAESLAPKATTIDPNKNVIQVVPDQSLPVRPSGSASYVVVTSDNVNIREQADMNSNIIENVHLGDRFDYLGSMVDGLGDMWYQIKYGKRIGCISAHYSVLYVNAPPYSPVTESTSDTPLFNLALSSEDMANLRKR